jgi:hypothetical protein
MEVIFLMLVSPAIPFGCQTLLQNVIPSVSFFNLGNKAILEIKLVPRWGTNFAAMK